MLVLNALSANMLALSCDAYTMNVRITQITPMEVRSTLLREGVESAVGHADTAAVFSSVLGLDISFNRETVSLKAGDQAIVGQYSGPRLPEGTTILPEGATIKWLLVSVGL